MGAKSLPLETMSPSTDLHFCYLILSPVFVKLARTGRSIVASLGSIPLQSKPDRCWGGSGAIWDLTGSLWRSQGEKPMERSPQETQNLQNSTPFKPLQYCYIMHPGFKTWMDVWTSFESGRTHQFATCSFRSRRPWKRNDYYVQLEARQSIKTKRNPLSRLWTQSRMAHWTVKTKHHSSCSTPYKAFQNHNCFVLF